MGRPSRVGDERSRHVNHVNLTDGVAKDDSVARNSLLRIPTQTASAFAGREEELTLPKAGHLRRGSATGISRSERGWHADMIA